MSAERSDEADEATPLRHPGSPLTSAAGDVEEIPLSLVHVSGHGQDGGGGGGGGGGEARRPERCRPERASCCHDEHHRKLAVCSIVCGITCIGYKALIASVRAEMETDPEAATTHKRRAKKLGIISIVLWLSLLASIPILMCLVSYLLTFFD